MQQPVFGADSIGQHEAPQRYGVTLVHLLGAGFGTDTNTMVFSTDPVVVSSLNNRIYHINRRVPADSIGTTCHPVLVESSAAAQSSMKHSQQRPRRVASAFHP
jgi:hypothetical protein